MPERPIEVRGVNIALGCQARQEQHLWRSQPPPARAVNGVKHGTDSFHTAYEPIPGGRSISERQARFDEIVIYNRLNVMCRRRSRWLQVLLSDDGEIWDPLLCP